MKGIMFYNTDILGICNLYVVSLTFYGIRITFVYVKFVTSQLITMNKGHTHRSLIW